MNKDPEAEQVFKRATEAYEVLGDPDRRREYDSPPSIDFDFDGLSQMMGFRSRRMTPVDAAVARAQAGIEENVLMQDKITFEESYKGAPKSLAIQRIKRCDPCSGSGRMHVSGDTCADCGGKGMKYMRQGNTILGGICPACKGQDPRVWELCPACAGRGGMPDETVVKFSVPAGTQPGSIFRFQGCGNWVPVESAHGDAYLRVEVEAHPDFARSGDNLTCERTLDYKDIILGTVVTLDVFGTPVAVDVPRLSCPGDVITVPGLGFRGQDLQLTVQMSRDIPGPELDILETIRKGSGTVIDN